MAYEISSMINSGDIMAKFESKRTGIPNEDINARTFRFFPAINIRLVEFVRSVKNIGLKKEIIKPKWQTETDIQPNRDWIDRETERYLTVGTNISQ